MFDKPYINDVVLGAELQNSLQKAVARPRYIWRFFCARNPIPRRSYPHISYCLRGQVAHVQGFGLKAVWLDLLRVLNPRSYNIFKSVSVPAIATKGAQA